MPKQSADTIPALKWMMNKIEEHDKMLREISAILRDMAHDEQVGAIQIILSSMNEEHLFDDGQND